MEEPKGTPEPIQQSVHVDCPIDEAFRLFTDQFGEWWPLSEDCRIEPWPGGRVFERTSSGDDVEWGSVTAWNPPDRVEFTWHAGSVEVEFAVDARGTRVTLTHYGWHLAGIDTSVMRAAA